MSEMRCVNRDQFSFTGWCDVSVTNCTVVESEKHAHIVMSGYSVT